ncbi:hypothetical protein [Limnobaculum parvum]|uniref:Uncharacterized protein n=1 Tax=Limnobaculum parvum TaxID=2172103 RepID=A0A2Y9TW65_9GAMM|nr:hypothetical protein [Limnobaculum parvum]AWH87684.1 hypothetical protein HYN51_03350 [Limnobaculum parvum]
MQDAEEILRQDFSQVAIQTVEEDEDEDESSLWCCSHCASKNVVPFIKDNRPTFVMFILLGFSRVKYQYGIMCNDCGEFTQK